VAERFTGKNLTLPILANVLLEVRGNEMSVTATNLEYGVEVKVPGRGAREGKVSVPAKVLSSLLQSLQEDKVEFEEKQSNLYIRSDLRESRINGMNSEEFPLIPKIKKMSSATIEAVSLKDGLEKILPAVSTSEFKPELTGIYFYCAPMEIRLAATDTFRLAEKTFPFKGKDGEKFSFILPQRVALELSRVISASEKVEVGMGDNQVVFEIAGTKIVSRLIEGNFPEYAGIIPKVFEITAFIKRDELLRAVRSASIFSSKIQEVVLRFDEEEVEISSANTEVGEHKVNIPISATGKGLSISFNYRYLLDGLGVLDEEEVFVGINGENSPSLLKNKSDGSFQYVLMPIRLSG
jgi:DNA polymerase-3 subunit beta